jgi:hypothetical protein
VGTPVVIETIVDDPTAGVFDGIQTAALQETAVDPSATLNQTASKLGETTTFSGMGSSRGDVCVTGTGTPDPTYEFQPNETIGAALPPYLPVSLRNTQIEGTGLLSTSGSGQRARYAFRKGGQTQFQYRATPNQFGRVTDVLAHQDDGPSPSADTSMRENCFSRPSFLALNNGNLLCGYLSGGTPPYTWTWASSLESSPGQLYLQGPGGGSRSGIVTLHLLDKTEMLWSISPSYRVTLTGNPGLDESATYRSFGVTGFALVQFPDTDEVLGLYAGYYGPSTGRLPPNGFFAVDLIRNTFADYVDFTKGGDPGLIGTVPLETENRTSVRFLQDIDSIEDNVGDVAGVTINTAILDITAQVMPSGRLVCVIITQRQLISLVSDDRGVTWRGRQIMEITFQGVETNNVAQRCGSVSSCMGRGSQMVVLAVCNGINQRAVNSASSRQESVISLFVTGDGEMYGREKRLGYGTATDQYDAATSNSENDLDEAVYALSGAVCLTPSGFIHVCVTSLKMGAPAGTHAQWLMTRTLSVRDLLSGSSDQEVARSIPDLIQNTGSPVGSRTHRVVPALVQTGSFNAAAVTPVTILNYQLEQFAAWGTNIGYVANADGFQVDTSSTDNLGGGPVWSNGPIDVAMTLWRGQIVTAMCSYYTNLPLDFPDAGSISNPANPWPDTEANRESSVAIYRSAHHTPINVRIPTQLQVVAANLSNVGTEIPLDRGGAVTRAAGTEALYGSELGSNAYSVNWSAETYPPRVGWREHVNGTTLTEFDSTNSDNRMICGGARKVYASIAGSYAYYAYPEQYAQVNVASWQADYAMPNAGSDVLKTTPDASTYYQSKKGGLGFVCRVVAMLDFGLDVDPTGTGDPDPNQGVRVVLTDTAAGAQAALCLHFWRPNPVGPGGDPDVFNFYLSDYDAPIAASAISLTSPDLNTPAHGSSNAFRTPWFEAVFGLRYNQSTFDLEPFLFVRFWERASDPDFLNDFAGSDDLGTLTPTGVLWGEGVSFGAIRTTAGVNERQTFWKSVQFARTFLKVETTDATVHAGSIETFPLGDAEYLESLHQHYEPAMQMFQTNNAGLLSPMGPAQAVSSPSQFLDRGVGVEFRGRATANRVFTYSAVSRHPASGSTGGVLDLPVSFGWRSGPTEISRLIDTSAVGDTAITTYTPATEIILDFGEEIAQPEAFAMFGINAPAVSIELSRYPAFPNDLIADRPEYVFAVSPPGDAYQKVDRHIQTSVNGGLGWMWKPRYLFYCQMYRPGTGEPQSLGDNDLRYSFDPDGRTVRFATGDPANAARHLPFRPNRFRSVPGQAFYLVVTDQNLYPQTDESVYTTLYANAQTGQYRHVFEIEDNGANWLRLKSPIGDYFTTTAEIVGKWLAGSMAIISDRFAFNTPDQTFSADPLQMYRYMRIRVAGARYHGSTTGHTLGFMVAGKRIDLSNRDFDWGWSMNVDGGRALTVSTSGQRRSRVNHRPRRKFSVKYSPKPSEAIVIDDLKYDGSDGFKVQNPRRGYGNSQSATPGGVEDSQTSFLSRTSWQGIVDRVVRVGIGGEVFALGFDGDNMAYSYGGFPPDGSPYALSPHPVLSDPDGLTAARVISFGGASHVGYSGVKRLTDNGDGCVPAPIMGVGGIEFSEEL